VAALLSVAASVSSVASGHGQERPTGAAATDGGPFSRRVPAHWSRPDGLSLAPLDRRLQPDLAGPLPLHAATSPPASIARARALSAWEAHHWHLLGAGLLIQGFFIALLLAERRRRRRVQDSLGERLRFETLLSELSATLITLSVADLDRETGRALRRIVEELDLDRATLAEVDDRPGRVRIAQRWERPGIRPIPASFEAIQFPWMASRLSRGSALHFSRLEELPEEASTDRQTLLAMGSHAVALIPLMVEGAVVGVLTFASQRERAWPSDLVHRLHLLGEVFANALARRRAASAVQESQSRFRVMADSAPLMVWLAGTDARRTYFNRCWLDFTGRPPALELGEGWTTSIHPDDRPACLKTLRAAAGAQRPLTLEYRLRRSDGDYRWVLDHGVPRIAADGAFDGYIGSSIDVTELKAAQRSIAETQELGSAIFGSLYGHVAALDRNGVIIAVNHSWTALAQGTSAEPGLVSVGARYAEVCRRVTGMGEASARRAFALLTAVLEGRRDSAQLEYASTSSKGERWFDLLIEPFRRPEGGAIVSHIDITRRRRAEDEAGRRREELAHALRVATLGELSGTLAHDISQPLAAIMTNAQATLRLLDRGQGRGEEVREALADIADDSKRAAQVIHRLRILSRNVHGERQTLSINDLVEEVVTFLRGELRRKGIGVVVSLDKALPPVLGDPIQLQQVLLNLLINAGESIAAAGASPCEVRVETARREVQLLEISISDAGTGVAEVDLERIFEPFVSTKADGLGMGLSISRSIVEAHGGRIWATRNLARGLTVHVELLCEEGSEAA
jgi:PAS domain S-box-containing protein